MAKIYLRQINKGKLTIDDVPERWKEAVQTLLDTQNAEKSE